jgi:hypothetical protein
MALDEAERKHSHEGERKPGASVPTVPGGELALRLAIDESRVVSGSAKTGANTATVRGVLEGDSLRVRFVGDRMTGTVVCEKSNKGFVGHAHLSVLEGREDDPETIPLRGAVELYRSPTAR